MNKIDKSILNINKVICQNIKNFDASQRGLKSQNILAQLRNFVEAISLKICYNGQNVGGSHKNIKKAIDFIKKKGKLKFLSEFHKFLQQVVSHYTYGEENSERLMLKYYEYLIKIKSFLKSKYSLDVLQNIDDFPLKMDKTLSEYYEKIANKINHHQKERKVLTMTVIT